MHPRGHVTVGHCSNDAARHCRSSNRRPAVSLFAACAMNAAFNHETYSEVNSPRLLVFVHGEPALRLNPAGGRFANDDAAEWLHAANRLSCGWNAPIDVFRLGNWLDHLLPENGMLVAARAQAAKVLLQHGVRREPSGAGDILWGNLGLFDCPGAVSVMSEFEDGAVPVPPQARPPSIPPIDDNEVGVMVRWAVRLDSSSGPQPTRPNAMSVSSLTGFRPKIGLHHSPITGRWHPASGAQPSTHIVKYEDHSDLPGEAVAEAVALRALNMASIPAATTVARVFDGMQCVVSERTDRVVQHDKVVAVHQEEWGQAACLSTQEKFHSQTEEPSWPSLLGLLRAGGPDREAIDYGFIRALVGCMLLAHTDLHRQNIGIISSVDGRLFHLAPLYDVSCADGRPASYSRALALPIGRATAAGMFDATALRWLADACGMRQDLAIDAAKDVAERLPDAIAQAKRASMDRDEARVPRDARLRLEAMTRGVESRSSRLLFDMGLVQAQTS